MSRLRFVLAPDSFKGSMSAGQAAEAMARGLSQAWAEADLQLCPLADGGEGTAEALAQATGGSKEHVLVRDPLGGEVIAQYHRLPDQTTIVFDMAAAAGFTLVPDAERRVMRLNTYGCGQLLRHAAACGAKHVMVGLGGSATVDGGIGLLAALGIEALDAQGRVLEAYPDALAQVARLRVPSHVADLAADLRVTALVDVRNPLLGAEGAAQVFGPQKGATADEVERLEVGLRRWAKVLEETFGRPVRDLPGSGAAGGLGVALVAALGATIEEGAPAVLQAVGFREKIANAACVFTGEGRLDRQSMGGKVPAAVGKLCREVGVPCIALVGQLDASVSECQTMGIDAAFSLVPGPRPLSDALANGRVYLEQAAAHVGHVLALGHAG